MIDINWSSIIQNLGLFSIGIGFSVWLVKTLGKYAIDKRLVAYKEELNIKSNEYQLLLNTDLENHKAKLNIEHTQYQKLQEKRLEIMAEVYKKIAELDGNMNYLVQEFKLLSQGETSEENDKVAIKNAGDTLTAFANCYLTHKIFFSEANCKLLDAMLQKYWASWLEGTTRQRIGNTDPEYIRESMKKAADMVRNDIPIIKQSLETEFRNYLGVK